MRMKFSPDIAETLSMQALPLRVRMGFDLVQVSGITRSVESFGAAFTQRFFTADEIAYAEKGMRDERLAARFAAKEATIKALELAEAGVDWRQIEVRQLPQGGCELALHGTAKEIAEAAGITSLALSLSHEGDYAGAVVTALAQPQPRETQK
jgi:holo-[acyl-carrier protein] synthase